MSGIVLLAFLQNVVCALLSAVCLIVGTTRANLPRDIFVVLLVKVSPGWVAIGIRIAYGKTQSLQWFTNTTPTATVVCEIYLLFREPF